MAETLVHRARLAALAATVLGGVTAGSALAVAHATAVPPALPAAAVPGVLPGPGGGACLGQAQARAVWQSVEDRIDLLLRNPAEAGVDAVAEGAAATQLRAYVQTSLLDQHLSEHQLRALTALTVLQAGCGVQPLTVRATVTLAVDDYLTPDGQVDHSDPGVGQASQVLESFVRSGAGWKVITIAPLGAAATPSAAPPV